MRVLVMACASFVGGLFVSSLLGWYLSFVLVAVFAVFGLIAFAFRRKLPMQRLWLCLLAAALGAAWCGIYTVFVYDRAVGHAQTAAVVEGSVNEITKYEDGTFCYQIRVHQIDQDRYPVGFLTNVYSDQQLEATYGERFIGRVDLQQAVADGAKLFDKNYSRGVYLKGNLQEPPEIVPAFSLTAPFRLLRDECMNIVNGFVAKPMSAVLNGVLFGDRSEIPYSIQRDFDRCGVVHILAVSGLHVAVLGAILLAVLRALKVPKKLCSVLLIGGIFCFVALAGFTPSALRAGWMAAISCMGTMFHRRVRALESLAATAVVLLVLQPYTILGLSFILSFSSSLGIILLANPLMRWMQKRTDCYGRAMGAVLESVAASFSAMLFSVPALVLTFGRVSWISIFTNLILIPLLPAVFVFGMGTVVCGFFFPMAAMVFGYLAQGLCGAICSAAHWIAQFPWCYLPATGAYVPISLAACLTVILCALFAKHRKAALRMAAFCCCFLLAVPAATYWILYHNAVRIDVVGNGYGSSVVVHANGSTVVVGCGGGYLADRSLCQLLDRRGISKIDLLILPSASKKDASGALDLVQEFPVGVLLLESSMTDGDIARYAAKQGATVADASENSVSLPKMTVSTTSASGSLAVQIKVNGLNIVYSDNISCLQAMGQTEYLNIALIDQEFEGWYGDFEAGCSVILTQQESCPAGSWKAPPNATTSFVVDDNKMVKEGC